MTIIKPADSSAGAILAGKVFYQGALNFGIEYVFLNKTLITTFAWNNDFLLASAWQKGIGSTGTVTGTDYCTQGYISLDATELKSEVRAGITGGDKCTFQVASVAAKGAAQVVLTKAGLTKFNMQWAEWESGLLTDGSIGVKMTDTTPLFLGTVTKAWPNPLKSWAVNGALTQASFVSGLGLQPINDYSPDADGYTLSPGKIAWWPSEKINGAVSTTATTQMDFLKLKSEYDTYTAAANTYNTAVTTYNTNKDAYNKALTDEAARKADFFKAMFDPAVTIPERPCQPDRPAAFSGVDFKYDTTVAITTAEKAAMKGTFAYNGGSVSANTSFRVGYQLPAITDAAITAGDGAGHTYGYFGAGNLQVVTTNKAFQWKAATATATHHMMVSVLPYLSATTATAAVIEFTWNNKAFDDTMYAISKPSQPAATTAPDAVAAKALAASAVAVAAIAASLF